MQRNIFFINDMPFSLAYGGKEVQLLGYKHIIEKSSPAHNLKLLDPWDRFSFPPDSILHLFGSGKWFHNLLGQAKQKLEICKIIISPTFYYDNPWKLRIGNILSRLTPFEDQFSYKRFIFDAADALVVNSRAEGEQIAHIFGEHISNKMIVIPNTIADDYATISDGDCFLSKYELEPGYVLSVGFLDERKNSIRLVQAFLGVYPLIKRKLVLIGGARFLDSKNAKLLDRLVSQNRDTIVHIPFLPTGSDLIKSAYKNCAFHVLPSLVETPGIANLEALAFGKNIVVGECAPVREYFAEYALYSNPISKTSIARSILLANEAILDNKQKQLAMFVNQKYTHHSICDSLLNLYA